MLVFRFKNSVSLSDLHHFSLPTSDLLVSHRQLGVPIPVFFFFLIWMQSLSYHDGITIQMDATIFRRQIAGQDASLLMNCYHNNNW